MPLQILWRARCRTAFTFTGARVKRTAGGKLAVRCQDCGAINEIMPHGTSEDGRELYKVVGEVRPAH
jgi:flavoprotein